MKTLPSIALLLLLTITAVLFVGCDSTDRNTRMNADTFRITLEKEIDAYNSLISVYNSTNFETDSGKVSFQRTVPNHISAFNSFLDSYQFSYSDTAPQELNEALKSARGGTSSIIFGINSINSALTSSSYSQWSLGEDSIYAGGRQLDQASAKSNLYVDVSNAQSSTPLGFGIIIGTGMVWLLTILIINPITKFLARREYALQYVDGRIPDDANEISEKLDSINTKTYILVDTLVLGMVGFLMGYLVGWYFIGITWQAKHWPGLIAFIGLSLLGSSLYV